MLPDFRVDINTPAGGKVVFFKCSDLIQSALNTCHERMKHQTNPLVRSVHPLFNLGFADVMLRPVARFFLFNAPQLIRLDQTEGIATYEQRLLRESTESSEHQNFCSMLISMLVISYLICTEKSIRLSFVTEQRTCLNLVGLPSILIQHLQIFVLEENGFSLQPTPYLQESCSFANFFKGEGRNMPVALIFVSMFVTFLNLLK